MTHYPPTEANLIARACEGDREAYAELVRRYQDVAVATAFLVLRERQDAEDAVQEAFTKAFVALPRFRPDGSFRAWLLRIVANEARTIRGAAQRRAELASRGAAGAPTSPAPSAEAGALAQERRAALLEALFELPEADRLVVTYRYFFDLSEAEMAEVLAVARGTIKSRLSRALARLRPILRDVGPLVVVGPVLDVAMAHAFQELRHTPLGQPSPHLSQAVLARLGDAPVARPVSRPGLQQAIQHAFSASTVAVVGAVVGVALLTTQARTALTDRLRAPAPAPAPQVLVYGGDLSDADRQELRTVLGARADAAVEAVSRQELADVFPIAPTDKALSSAALTCQDPSAGLAARALNIARVPASAYAGALLTAGVQGASVTVAAPEAGPGGVSGETALVGVLKAAAACLGHPADPRRVELAYQQLDLLSALADDNPDLNDASELLLRLLDGVVSGQPSEAVLAAEAGQLDGDQRAATGAFLDRLRGLDFGPYARGFHVQQNEPVEGSYAILPN